MDKKETTNDDFVDFGQDAFEANPEQDLLPPADDDEKAEKTDGNGVKQIEAQPSEEDRDGRSVFVKNVHYSADKKEIEDHFKDCGEIKLVTIMTNKMTHQPLG